LQRAYRRNEPVTFAHHSLNVPGTLGIIVKGLAKFAYRGINAAIRLKKYVFAPELFYDLVAADKFPLSLYQEDKQLHGDLFQFQRPLAPTQLKAARI
jgi:hypothetical protein